MGLNVKQKVKHFTNKNRSMSKVMQRFLRLDTKAKFIKKPIDELYFVKVKKKKKNFCSAKSHVKRMKRRATQREKTFAHHIANKGLVSRMHEKFSK